jgi:hypothetical protein
VLERWGGGGEGDRGRERERERSVRPSKPALANMIAHIRFNIMIRITMIYYH